MRILQKFAAARFDRLKAGIWSSVLCCGIVLGTPSHAQDLEIAIVNPADGSIERPGSVIEVLIHRIIESTPGDIDSDGDVDHDDINLILAARNQPAEDANDPLEPTNRVVFDVNMALDKAVLKPIAIAYRDVIPSDARSSLRNFFNNIGSPIIFFNDLLQGEPARGAETLMRFVINSTAGMLGLFDVAAEYGMERHKEDFGQTLAVWGFGEGPYMMLPLFGPSNVRDTVGRVADSFMNPFTYWARNNDLSYAKTLTSVVSGIDKRSRHIEELEDIEKNALDFYASLRSLYRQNRRSEILNGDVSDIPVPEIEDDEE